MNKIFWFRKSLRLQDNSALNECVKTCKTLYPVFILDSWHCNPCNIGRIRFEFIIESLRVLDEQLKAKGIKCGLLFFVGEPEKLLPIITKSLDVKTIAFDSSEEQEIHCRKTDNLITEYGSDNNVEIQHHVHGHWLHSPDKYHVALKGKPFPQTMSGFQKLFGSIGIPPKPVLCPNTLPFDNPQYKSSLQTLKADITPTAASTTSSSSSKDGCLFPIIQSLDDYKKIGRSHGPVVITNTDPEKDPCGQVLKFRPGEVAGLKRIQDFITERVAWTATFQKPMTSPNSLQPSTTVISPYLTSGCISVRQVFYAIDDCIKKHKGTKTSPPTSLVGQLFFREMWYGNAHFQPNFDISKAKNNPIARDIPWDESELAKKNLKKWEMGTTGYPFIDAIMTQLRLEGWIHHLARHMVACFLTRGDLWVSWEEGAKVFDRYLIDADYSLNSCNWMWLSCTAFFYQYFRCYSPIAFGKKTDPKGDYIRKYVPQLKNYPDKYIYEPWKAPLNLQKQFKCVIGTDYPKRIVDNHTVTSKENMAKMKIAYDKLKGSTSAMSNKKKLTAATATVSKKRKVGSTNTLDKFVSKKPKKTTATNTK